MLENLFNGLFGKSAVILALFGTKCGCLKQFAAELLVSLWVHLFIFL